MPVKPRRLPCLRRLGVLCLCLGICFQAQASSWPLWEGFKQGFISDQGRVIDWQDGARTVSEGQVYALFFALVANDQETFESVLEWSVANLARGNVADIGMAWLWGQDKLTKSWGVLDANPATDAEMFLAYALLEAARLWQRPDWAKLGDQVLARVESQMIKRQGDRVVLLPAPFGFELAQGLRTNPSYLPAWQLAYFAQHSQNPLWFELLAQLPQLLQSSSPHGLPPDWVLVTPEGYAPDSERGTLGSYDAIRCYLWAAMSPAYTDPDKHALKPVITLLQRQQTAPERWDVATGWTTGVGPVGFEASLALYATWQQEPELAQRLWARVAAQTHDGLVGSPARYYDQVLTLFAQGYAQNRFAFAADGALRRGETL